MNGRIFKWRRSIEQKPIKKDPSYPMKERNPPTFTVHANYTPGSNDEILADESFESSPKANQDASSSADVIEETFLDATESPPRSRDDFLVGSARRRSMCTLPLRVESDDESDDEEPHHVEVADDKEDYKASCKIN